MSAQGEHSMPTPSPASIGYGTINAYHTLLTGILRPSIKLQEIHTPYCQTEYPCLVYIAGNMNSYTDNTSAGQVTCETDRALCLGHTCNWTNPSSLWKSNENMYAETESSVYQ